MSLQVIINDSEVEQSSIVRIGTTFQANTIGNLENRQGTITNKFKLPKTKANQIIFENSDNINSNTNIPYMQLPAKLIQNGIELISDGVAVIDECDEFYNVTVKAGNTSFFDLIQGVYIQDLDLSEFDHEWTLANVYASRNNDEGYIYPFIETWFSDSDFSALYSTQKACLVYRMLCCVYMKTIWEAIVLESGYNQSGSFIESDQYSRLILPPKAIAHTSEWLDDKGGDQLLVTESDHTYSTNGVTFTTRIDNFTGMGLETHFNTSGVAIYDADEYMWGEFIISARFRIGLLGQPCYQINDFYIEIIDVTTGSIQVASSDIIDDITGAEWIAISSGVAVKVLDKELRTGRVQVIAGHQYQARIVLKESANMGLSLFYYSTLEGTKFSFVPEEEISFGGTMELKSLIENYKQKDFIKHFMNMYCVIPQVNEYTKTVLFNFFDDILDNIPNAVDWSDKVDEMKQVVITYRDTNYGQSNKFKYSADEKNSFDSTFTDGEILVNDYNLEQEKTLVQLPFAGTETIKRMVDRDVPHIKMIGSDYSIDPVVQRVLLLDREATGDSVTYSDGTSTSSTTTNLPYCYFVKDGANDNLSFNDSLLDNYSAISGIMQKYKKIVLYLKLNEVDIAQLDFTIPVYLDKHTSKIHINGYFYINKIENFQAGQTTKVELIRL